MRIWTCSYFVSSLVIILKCQACVDVMIAHKYPLGNPITLYRQKFKNNKKYSLMKQVNCSQPVDIAIIV